MAVIRVASANDSPVGNLTRFVRLGRRQESSEQLEIATRLEHEETQQRRSILRIAEPDALKK
jgi:hypothetical protein